MSSAIAAPEVGVLDAVYALLGRFIAFPHDAARRAVALWVLHTYAIDYANATPYLNVYSPAPRCGKSTLFDLLSLIVHDPVGSSNMSPAVIYRLVDVRHPTLLLDELDAQLRGDRDRASAIQSILNAGYRRGPTATVWRAEGKNFTPTPFDVFCPKAFAGIGMTNLHPTTLDRSIPILLERKRSTDPTERLHLRRLEPEAGPLCDLIRDWVDRHADELRGATPKLPAELDDRQQEIWEPLLAIADLTGGAWPAQSRSAALQLHTEPDLDDLPMSVLLLADIRRAFDQIGTWGSSSDQLCRTLRDFPEAPWGSWRTHGVRTGITPRALARMLRPFGIKPKTIRVGGETDKPTIKGYRYEWFEDAWSRYVPTVSEDHDAADAH